MMDVAGTKTCPECSEGCAADAQFCSHCGFPVGAVSRTEHDPLVGRVLPGGYHVLELIGTGGMGRVYRAQQRALGRTVAIKVIHPHLLAEEKSLARFLTEARATSQLNHPNTVSVIDFGQTDQGQPYLVMEFLRGKNLAQVVAQEGLLPLPRALGVLRQVLLALGEAHAIDIIHRDLKPENIIVEPLRRGGDFVKVVDFGLAKLKADDGNGITMPGIVCGTPDFMAPEQGRGDPIDGRSDLYAVGVVMFWLLCGRLPFEANTPTQVVMMHITMPVPDPREIAPQRSMPDAVIATLFRALAKDRNDRFPDALSFADEIATLEQMLENSQRQSFGPIDGLGLGGGASTNCPSCEAIVPWGRFCLSCGSELPPLPAPGAARPPSETLPFMGREEELRWLSEIAERGAHEFVLARLVGENGTGKTRLLEEFKRRQPSTRCVSTGPDPYWAEVPGYALEVLVRRLLSDLDVTELELLPRTPLSIVLRELIHGESAEALDPKTRRRAYASALGWAIERALGHGQAELLVCVDDFDRIDGVSQQAFIDLAAADARPSAAIVLTHSHRYNAPLLDAQVDIENARVLVGLPLQLATRLLKLELHGRMEIALANTAGAISPLYLHHVVRFALEGGTDAPPKLADLIAHRVTTLVGSQRASVQALAALGDRVSMDLLLSFACTDESVHEEYIAAVDGLVAAGIVKRGEDDSLSLAHPIFHDIVLLTTPAEARRELHRRAREMFAALGAPVEVLAEHAFLGQDVMAALVTLEQAATRAFARGDADTATHLLQRGLDLARIEIHRGELEDPLAAVVIFGRKLGETLQARGMFSDARGVLQEVLDATAPAGTDRAEVLAQLAEVAQHSNHLEDAERLLERALRTAREAQAPEGLVLGLELRLASVRSMPATARA
jgi:serine/threonine-protein kinase